MFGIGPLDANGYLLSRVMPYFDLHGGSNFRLFTEFKFNYVASRDGGPRPNVDEDKGDVHQAFVEVGPRVSDPQGWSLRAGRQEVVLGSGRLLDNNEGPNVKISFDGIRTQGHLGAVGIDLFLIKPVEQNVGFFDDAPMHQQTLWGTYFTVPTRLGKGGSADLYYMGNAYKVVAFSKLPPARETRHTFGVRAFRPFGKHFDYNWEADYQVGTFGDKNIRSWAVSTETGYTFDPNRFRLRPLLRVDTFSGDRSPDGHTLGTFNPLFPRGAYFTPKATPPVGPQNLVDLHPMVQFLLRRNLTGQLSWNWYWRESVADGLYAFGSGMVLYSATSSSRRYLGDQGDLELRWAPVNHTIISLSFLGFQTGSFFAAQPKKASPVAANLGFTFRF